MIKVSVIVPFNKSRGFLWQAIKSVEEQTYENIELVIAQGDGTLSENANKGIKRSSGEFIKILAEDDYLPADAIEQSVDALLEAHFCHGKAVNFTKLGQETYTPNKSLPNVKDLVKRNQIHGGTVLYRRELFEKLGYFDESLTTGEEYDLHMRFLKGGAKLAYVDEILHFCRIHDDQKSIGKMSGSMRNMRKKQIEQIKARYV